MWDDLEEDLAAEFAAAQRAGRPSAAQHLGVAYGEALAVAGPGAVAMLQRGASLSEQARSVLGVSASCPGCQRPMSLLLRDIYCSNTCKARVWRFKHADTLRREMRVLGSTPDGHPAARVMLKTFCACGYSTYFSPNMKRHRRSCEKA